MKACPAQAVKLVADGQLENYLIGRDPVRDFPESNGHARAGVTGPPHPVIGVLKITAQQGLTDDELNRKLLDLAKDRGLKSVYFVETLGGRSDTAAALSRSTWTASAKLVRGAVLDDLDQRALRSGVEAAGKDLWVANYAIGRSGDRARPRAALRRRHRKARQREERQAALLPAAGIKTSPLLLRGVILNDSALGAP